MITEKNKCSSGGKELMETGFVFATLFEIALVAFVIFGLFNEEKFAETERKAFRYIKRFIRSLINGGHVSSERI